MKFFLELLILSFVASIAYGSNLKCEAGSYKIDENWTDMKSTCIDKVRDQIKEEINAALQYLMLGAHFSKDTKNRPGFAKFFLDAAKEEREHAMHLLEYLTMRGELSESSENLLKPSMVSNTVETGEEALKLALKSEVKVTESIKSVIKECDSHPQDYHLVDYLTGVYLEEQYKGQRDIAGKLSTLGKMMTKHGELGEFLFDKTLL